MEFNKELLLNILREQEGEFTLYIDLTQEKEPQDANK